MLKIRLRRMGARNQPYYRVVVSDSRQTSRAEVLEEIGSYHPLARARRRLDRPGARAVLDRPGRRPSRRPSAPLARPEAAGPAPAARPGAVRRSGAGWPRQ